MKKRKAATVKIHFLFAHLIFFVFSVYYDNAAYRAFYDFVGVGLN